MDIKVKNYTEIINTEIIVFLAKMSRIDLPYNEASFHNNLNDIASDFIKRNNISGTQAVEISENMQSIQTFFETVYEKVNVPQDKVIKYFGELLSENLSIASILIFHLPHSKKLCGFNDSRAIYSCICYAIQAIVQTDILDDKEIKVINNHDEFISYIEHSKISDKAKWQCINLVSNYQQYYDEITKIISDTAKIYNDHIYMIQTILDEQYANIQKVVEEIKLEEMTDRFNIGFDKIEDVQIAISISGANGAGLTEINDGEKIFFMGLLYEYLRFEITEGNQETSYPTIKNLGEKRKFEIIMELKKCPCNGLELSEKLGITPATISFHMKQLVNSGMVGIEIGEKSAYHIRKNRILDDIDVIIRLFE